MLENVLTKRTNKESIQAIGDNIAYSCYPCNKNFSNDKYYKQHCSGKKHLTKVFEYNNESTRKRFFKAFYIFY